MKKISYLLLSVMLMLSVVCLGACSKDESEDTSKEAISTKEEASTTAKDNETEAPSEDDSKVTYNVKVVDEAGNAIAGAMVQLCNESCVPGKTDDSGVAEFKLEEADYKVSLMTMPAGYAHIGEEEEFYFEEGKTEMTITLKAQ